MDLRVFLFFFGALQYWKHVVNIKKVRLAEKYH